MDVGTKVKAFSGDYSSELEKKINEKLKGKRILHTSITTQMASRLDEDERRKFNLPRQGNTHIVNESGLYKVIFRSDKPEAKAFTKWVTSEILPAIRKHGMYTTLENKKKIERIEHLVLKRVLVFLGILQKVHTL